MPTFLELAGVAAHSGTYAGREAHAISGKSMLGLLGGQADQVHGPGDAVAYELAGSAAVFRNGYKLLKNNPPFGNKAWRLYRVVEDPVEANDLSEAEPEILAEMIAAYERYAQEVNLIEVPEDYNPVLQVQKNVELNQAEEILEKVPVTIE